MSAKITLLRSPDSPDAYLQAFTEAGFSATCQPVLMFSFPHQEMLIERLKAADVHSGLVLTSPRAVGALRRAFDAEGSLKLLWEDKPVFVVGPKTASEVRGLGLTPQAQAAGDAEALVESIGAVWDEKNLRSPLLFLSGNRRRDTLPTAWRTSVFLPQSRWSTPRRPEPTLTSTTTPNGSFSLALPD